MTKHLLLIFAIFFPIATFAELTPEDISALNQNTPGGGSLTTTSGKLAFRSENGKLVGIVSGSATATMGWDFNNVVDNPNEFITFDIPVNAAPGNGGSFQLSAQQTALQLNLVALPDDVNRVGAFFKVTMLGNNYSPWIEYALLNWRGLSVGYGYTLFSDSKAALPTIDFQGPCAYTGISNTVLQYRRKLTPVLSAGIALEMPTLSATFNNRDTEVSQRVPDIPVMVSYDKGGNHLRVSGVVRNMMYRDNVSDKNRDCVGWGVQLSGKNAICPALTLFWQGAYGKGLASYFQDFNGGGLDMTPGPDGKMRTVKVWGAYAGLQYNFTNNIYACAGYSHLRAYPKRYTGGDCLYANQPSYTQYAVGNLFWQINNYLCWGIEYIYGRRVDMNRQQGHASRVQTMLQFSF